jgi:hypothetical protein
MSGIRRPYQADNKRLKHIWLTSKRGFKIRRKMDQGKPKPLSKGGVRPTIMEEKYGTKDAQDS